jgi:glycosyltransferase involved in cell wall biosynthesis
MRVLVVSRIYLPEAAAASFRLDAVVAALVDGGAEVDVLTTDAPAHLTADDARRPRARVRRAPVLRDRTGYVRGYLPYLSFDIPVFFRTLFSRRWDVAIAEPPPTTGMAVRLAAAIRRRPYVYYAADVWSDAASATSAPRIVVRVVRWMERRALRGAAAVIAVSDGVAERVRTLAPRARVTVVPNGIDTAVFRSDGDVLENAPWGVYAGTTSEWQGADAFIRAMPAVRRELGDAARILFVGQGSAWEELRALAAEIAPGSVEFRPPVPPEEAAELLRSARVGLVSLRSGAGYDFAVPTKIFAAAATGTPVLFVGDGPSRAVIRNHRLGSSCDEDAASVTLAMTAALRTPPSLADRRERAARVGAAFSWGSRSREAADVIFSVVRP